jgi:hypothetical protein
MATKYPTIDPFVQAEADTKAWESAETASNPPHAPVAAVPLDVAILELRVSVRALGTILVRFEQLVRDESKARATQTQAILEHAKISQAILDEIRGLPQRVAAAFGR